MKSILLITKQRFKANLKQYLQLLIALVLTVFCISLALNLLKVADKPFDLTFEKLKAAHLLLLFDSSADSSNDMTSWFQQQEEVDHIGPSKPYVMNKSPFLFKGKELDMNIQITERIGNDSLFNKLLVVKGEQKHSPDIGEIWLPFHFENLQGVALGDEIEIAVNGELYQFTVSAFVADPHYLSPIFNPTRAWVAPGALAFFMPVQDLKQRMLEVRLKDEQHIEEIWRRFEAKFDFKGTHFKYGIFKRAYSGFSKLLSSILLLFGLVILVISLIIVNSGIRSSILQDFKQIGVLKSLGFTKRNIIGSYLTQSILLLWIAIPLGGLLSGLVLSSIMRSTLKSIGILQFTTASFSPYVLTAFLLSFLVLIVSYLSSKKAAKAMPIEALRKLNAPQKKISLLKKSVFTSGLPLSLLMAVRFIRNSISASISLLLGLLAAFIIVLFAVNIYTSFDQLQENKTAWGFTQSDLELQRKSSIVLPLNHKELIAILNNQYPAEIKRIIPYSHTTAAVIDTANRKQQIFGKVYATDLNKSELLNLEGTHPATAREISLCEGTARQFNKRVGDSVLLEMDGIRKAYEVSAIYQDISTFGQGFRIHETAVLELNPVFEPVSYGLVLHNKVDPHLLKQDLQEELGEAVAVEDSVEKRMAIVGLLTNIKLGVLLISLLFILIALFLISNDILIQVRQNKLIFAQLKTIGFTSRQLRSVTVLRVAVVFLVGLLLGVPAGFALEQPLANSLARGIGLVEFPFVVSSLSIGSAIAVLFALILITAWYSSKFIGKINPRELVEV